MPRSRAHTRRTSRSNPRGVLSVRSAGFGFVQTPEGEYFIPTAKMNGAFDGDLVELAPERKGGARKAQGRAAGAQQKRVARVLRVIERAHADIVGRFEIAEPFGVVVPADPRIPYDIFTQLSEHPEIPDGAIVRVAINEYPTRKSAATGTVVEVLGDEGDERVPVDLIIARHKFEVMFGDAALGQAASCEVDAEGALANGYRDLRERVVFTIDPADARDFDDAVSVDSVEWRGKACARVGVHIADVAAYVPWGSSIDLEARRRATSVYLVDRVLPMLPEKLSNDVCSLRPGEERRTMTVDMVVDDAGRVVDVDAYPAIIRSRARLTYEQAQNMLDGGTGLPAPIAERVRALSQLARKRIALREEAGGLDFDTVEAKVRLDEAGVPLEVVLRERTDATSLIEECMIMANEAVAAFLRDAGFPCLFRVHEKPSRESLDGLVPVLQEFPWFKDIDAALFVAGNPHEVQRVLEKCARRPEAELVTSLVLRAMKRAIYSPELSEHYALASVAYAHFTSPIRRYPDLVVHRMLKAALGGRPEKFDQEVAALPWLAEHSSHMEREAELAARESQEVKIVELMESHVGENFSAMIAGVATYGMFVRLENTAEGMVEMADMGHEYFALDPVRHTLTGSDSGRCYRLGQHVAVKLVEADRRTSHLRFKLL